MNYLAHIYLSGSNKKILLGNFMADGLKGNQWKNYDLEIKKGILLHRAIDNFTDTHAIVKQSKKRIWDKYRHYNAVIIDIFYDHFLAKNWHNYHSQTLQDFVHTTYLTLENNVTIMPGKVQLLLSQMIKNNWLYNYKKIKGIDRVMQGMARRASFNSKMEYASHDLKEYYSDFFLDFESFFPLLQAFVKEKIKTL